MISRKMVRGSALRLAAPVALLAFAVVWFAVIIASCNATPEASGPAAVEQRRAAPKASKVYVVRRGDTLGAISNRTGVARATLERLNPSLDPMVLRPGQRLRLRR